MRSSHFQNYSAVLIKPKRQKWMPISSATKAEMKESLESALNGSGQWNKYSSLDFKTVMTIDDL